jgi:hypothetical protein
MTGILGLRNVIRRRYATGTTWTNGFATRPTPTSATVKASVDVAPRSRWALDESGNRTVRVVDLVSYAEFRAASADYLADRVVIDGRTYEVQDVVRMEPFEGTDRTHFETTATEIRGADEGTP